MHDICWNENPYSVLIWSRKSTGQFATIIRTSFPQTHLKKNAIPFFFLYYMFFLSRYPIYYYYFFIFPSCFYFYFIRPVAPFVTSFSFFPWFVWFFNPAFLLSWFLLNLFCQPLLHFFIIFFFCDPFFYRSKFSVQTFEWLSISSDFVGPACVPQV